jgi:hypothetical protein
LLLPLYGFSSDSDELHLGKSLSIVRYQCGALLPLPDTDDLSRMLTFHEPNRLVFQRSSVSADNVHSELGMWFSTEKHAFLRLRVPLATVAAAQDSALRLSIVTPLATATMRRFLVTQYMSTRCPPGSSDGLEVEKHCFLLRLLSRPLSGRERER